MRPSQARLTRKERTALSDKTFATKERLDRKHKQRKQAISKKKNVPEKNHTEIQEKECSRTQNRKQGQRKDGISNKKEIFTSKETIRLWKKYQGNNANQKPYGTTNHEMGRNT
jgi:hypothetical protein